jgi:hypothetical protein
MSHINVVLWGLRKKRDSFRFISQGFYDSLTRQGIDVRWVDDKTKYCSVVDKNSLVIGVNVAGDNIPIVEGSKYVTLNIEDQSEIGKRLAQTGNWYKIQEFTNRSIGTKDSLGSVVVYNSDKKTLYMPWGTPHAKNSFLKPVLNSDISQNEYWVGAIWNDALNQGNRESIDIYKTVLRKQGIAFRRLGGSRLKLNGLSESDNAFRVRASRLGAGVVGNWQKNNQYYPCRLFKAVSFGVPPTSNLNAVNIFKDSLLHSNNIEEMTELALAEGISSRIERTKLGQKLIEKYTYEESFNRIMRMVNDDW